MLLYNYITLRIIRCITEFISFCNDVCICYSFDFSWSMFIFDVWECSDWNGSIYLIGIYMCFVLSEIYTFRNRLKTWTWRHVSWKLNTSHMYLLKILQIEWGGGGPLPRDIVLTYPTPLYRCIKDECMCMYSIMKQTNRDVCEHVKNVITRPFIYWQYLSA